MSLFRLQTWVLCGGVLVACGGTVSSRREPDGGGIAGAGGSTSSGGTSGAGAGGISSSGGAASTGGGSSTGGAGYSCDGKMLARPTQHRPASVSCPANEAATPCTDGGPLVCGAGCVTDSDCAPKSVCSCDGTVFGWAQQSVGNACLAGNCRTDADCSSGFCSSSYGEGGAFYGIAGYFCHTCEDSCSNDSQCNVDGGPAGYCAYQTATGAWACQYTFSAG